jgi:1,4-alpha-glucan branching enzyme
MVTRCSRGVAHEADLALLKQAARELMLAQSSDWSFILRAGTTTGLAKERIERHLGRFWQLMAALDGNEQLPEGWLNNISNDDNIFPMVQPLDWAKLAQS